MSDTASRMQGTIVKTGKGGDRYLTPATLAGLAADLRAAFAGEASCVVLTGPATGLFGLGLEPAALRGSEGLTGGYLEPLQLAGKEVLGLLAAAPVPTVAFLDGPALGASLTLALACDARCATQSDGVVLGYPELALGMLPVLGGVVYLTRTVGPGRSVEIIASGKRITASAARSLGLVDEVLQQDGPEGAATWAGGRSARLASWRNRPRRYPHGKTWLDRWFDGTEPGRRWLLRRVRRRLTEVRMSVDPLNDLYPAIENALLDPLAEAAALARRKALSVAGRPATAEALDRYAEREQARREADQA